MTAEHVVVSDDVTPATAAETMARAEADAVVVQSADGGVLGVLDEGALAALRDQAAPLAALAHLLPPLVMLAAEPDELAPEELTDVAEVVSVMDAPAVLLFGAGGLAGVVPRRAIASALPLSWVAGNVTRSGNPNVPALRYLCRKCAPPSFRMLRVPEPDGRPPTCIRVFHHGEMEAVP